jgi:glyoxylase-like metal-dependent hydrolase (beta-lactamase superfamily II)
MSAHWQTAGRAWHATPSTVPEPFARRLKKRLTGNGADVVVRVFVSFKGDKQMVASGICSTTSAGRRDDVAFIGVNGSALAECARMPRMRARVESRSRRVLSGLFFALCLAGPAKAANPEVKLYTLDCGRIDVPNMDPFADDGSYKGVTAQLVVPCYVIRHQKQYLLWDAGIGDQFAGPKGGTLPFGWAVHVPMTLAGQFKRLGLRFSDVSYLGFSHEHPDHMGNANLFPHATWLLNPREQAYAVKYEGQNGEPPALISASTTAHVREIDGTVDLFGDGSVTIIQAPGHTPGHQVLLVRPSGQQPVLLAGDLWTSRSNYEHDRVPTFDTGRADTIESRTKILEIVRQAGAIIWISHEPKDFHPTFNPNWRANSPG